MPLKLRCYRLIAFLLLVIFLVLNFLPFRLSNSSPILCPNCEQSNGHNATSVSSKSTVTTTRRGVVDMVNDYRPYVDFNFVFPDITPDLNTFQRLFMIVLVNSAAKGHRRRRDIIRRTWGTHKTCEQSKAMRDKKLLDLKWIIVFILGKTGSTEDQLNIDEARQNNDMLIGNIQDNYINNIIKLYMGKLWASTLAPKYLLKTDDDVYVRIPKIIAYLLNANFPSRFYGGKTYPNSKVIRNPGNKWGISKKYFAEDVWPPYNTGACYIMSCDLIGSLFNYVKHRKPFHTDDAYIGLAMKDMNVSVRNIIPFDIKNNMDKHVQELDDCKISFLIAIGHKLDPDLLTSLHDKVELICKNNTKPIC